MANPAGLAILAALVVTGALFAGSIAGTKPLALGLPNTGLTPTNTPGIAGPARVNGQTSGIYFSVSLNQPQGEPFVSGIRTGETSDFISFTVSAHDPYGCGGGQSMDPAFRWGSGANPAWAEVSLLDGNGNLIPFQISSSGLNYYGYPISFNTTGTVSGFCWNENTVAPCISCSTADYTSNLAGQVLESSPTIQLYGAYANALLQVQFHASWLDCGNTANQGVPACNANTPNGAGSPCTSIGYASTNCNQATVGGTAVATAQTIMYSGSANVYPLNGGGLYFNGQTMTFGATTGYGGSSGWTAEVFDVGRNSGGQDTAFAPIAVGNGVTTQFSWTIPASWSVISSTPNYNELHVVLESSFFNLPTTPVQVDINPNYAPSTPRLSFSVAGGALLPTLGSSVTVSIAANPPSQPISSGGSLEAIVWAFYLTNGQDVHTLPGGCGAEWISAGCQSGQTIALSPANGQWQGQFVFTVETANVPIGILATAIVSNTQQGSNESSLVINQVPVGCNPGQSCYPTPPGTAGFWIGIGPYVMMAFLLTAAIAIGYWGHRFSPYLVVVALGIGVIAVVILFPLAQGWYLQGVL